MAPHPQPEGLPVPGPNVVPVVQQGVDVADDQPHGELPAVWRPCEHDDLLALGLGLIHGEGVVISNDNQAESNL